MKGQMNTTNPLAFPRVGSFVNTDSDLLEQQPGMTLRDYFAAAALKGFLAAYNETADPEPDRAAKKCFDYADAMLKVRAQ